MKHLKLEQRYAIKGELIECINNLLQWSQFTFELPLGNEEVNSCDNKEVG